jgi:hypothetical protein
MPVFNLSLIRRLFLGAACAAAGLGAVAVLAEPLSSASDLSSARTAVDTTRSVSPQHGVPDRPNIRPIKVSPMTADQCAQQGLSIMRDTLGLCTSGYYCGSSSQSQTGSEPCIDHP